MWLKCTLWISTQRGKWVTMGIVVVGMLTCMTTAIVNGACSIGINAGHRTSN